ncbi:hypothetical protein WJX72_004931 [[Myrmecia] bisecta]|uniref:Hexosyltransferase n=1 Tax=[Myrmecia] bisecta TaxID=41462 RepID=A0AAW1Q7S6_9CHLO
MRPRQATPVKGGTYLALSLLVNLALVLLVLLWRPVKYDLVASWAMDDTIDRSEDMLKQLKTDIKSVTAELERAKQSLEAVPANEAMQQGIAERQAGGKLWLTIGIPTIPRKEARDYLTPTLEALLQELPLDPTGPLFAQVRVLVMNNRPGRHAVFDAVQARFAAPAHDDRTALKAAIYVDMVGNPGTVLDPAPDLPEPDDLNNPKNMPGREVRQQTSDLIALLQAATPLSHYYLFMEDDFRACPHLILTLQYLVRKLNSLPVEDWLSLRVSYGMNGILLRNEMLPDLVQYLRLHTARLPPDLLWAEFTQGFRFELLDVTHGRPSVTYAWNMLEHIGTVSSFAVRMDRPDFPACYQSMSGVWSIQPVERFSQRCNHTDMSPCPEPKALEAWMQHPLEWSRH